MKILLAIDTSPASQAVLEQVTARLWPPSATFEILNVAEPSHLWTTSEAAEEAKQQAEDTVKRAVQRLRASDRDVMGIVESGDPKTVILDRAESTGADFVVVGSHSASTLTRFLMGNVATAVLRYAPCSVEVVRSGVRAQGSSGGKKVLLATDGSECSELAARSLADFVFPAGTEVRILSAVELVLPGARAFFEPPFVDSESMEALRAEAMQRAQDAIAAATKILSSTGASTGLTVSESISVLVESPRTVILDEAARWGADLVVLGSHGRRGVGRFLLGSVSEAVALHAACSVAVIRKRELRTPVEVRELAGAQALKPA
jgi:nucleotide-binding universal stress UspA family protein